MPVPASGYQEVHPFSLHRASDAVEIDFLGGRVVSRLIASAATNNALNVSATPRTLLGIDGWVARATACYLKLFNKSTTPNPAADIPFDTIYLGPAAAIRPNVIPVGGIYFSTGIGYALVTGGADLDNTAVALNDVLALRLILSA